MKEKRREKEEERKWDGTCTPCGELRKRGSRMWGSPLMGKSAGTEGEHLRVLEEGETAGLWQTGQSETYADGMCHSPACPRLGRVPTGTYEGWELEHGEWKANPGKGLPLAVRRQPEGLEGRKSATGNAYEGNLVCHRSKVLLLSDTQWVEPPLQPLSPHAPPLPPRH